MERIVTSETLTEEIFLGDNGNIPFKSVSSRLDLDNKLDGNVETSVDEDFEDGEFPALKPHYNRRAHAHHMVTGHIAPQNSVPEFLTGRIQTQNNTLPQKLTQSQNIATHFKPTTHCQ